MIRTGHCSKPCRIKRPIMGCQIATLVLHLVLVLEKHMKRLGIRVVLLLGVSVLASGQNDQGCQDNSNTAVMTEDSDFELPLFIIGGAGLLLLRQRRTRLKKTTPEPSQRTPTVRTAEIQYLVGLRCSAGMQSRFTGPYRASLRCRQ